MRWAALIAAISLLDLQGFNGAGQGFRSQNLADSGVDYNVVWAATAQNDLDNGGASDNEAIGDATNVCNHADSDLTFCLNQTIASSRGTWQQASDCKTSDIGCWDFGAGDYVGGGGGTLGDRAEWDALGGVPTICHIGFALDSDPTNLIGLWGTKSSAASSRGMLQYLDTRTGDGVFGSVRGDDEPVSYLASGDCFSGVDITTPTLVTTELLGLGSNEWATYVNGTLCVESTVNEYAESIVTRLGIPAVAGTFTQAGEYYFHVCENETHAGSVAAMQATQDANAIALAAQLGVTLP